MTDVVCKILFLNLNFNVHTSGQVEPHQRVNRFRIGIDHINQPFVCTNLKMFVRILVNESSTANRETLNAGGQGNWP